MSLDDAQALNPSLTPLLIVVYADIDAVLEALTEQAATTDIKDVLVNLGFLADGGATPLDLDGGSLTCDDITADDVTVDTLTSANTVINGALDHNGSGLSFFNSGSPVTKPTVSGSRADGEGALKDLLAELASLGLITNSTTT